LRCGPNAQATPWPRLRSPVHDGRLRLASLATGTLREHAPGLCVDEEEQALLLQVQLPATTDAEQLEAQLAQFVNVWAFWRHACLQETGRIEPSGRR